MIRHVEPASVPSEASQGTLPLVALLLVLAGVTLVLLARRAGVSWLGGIMAMGGVLIFLNGAIQSHVIYNERAVAAKKMAEQAKEIYPSVPTATVDTLFKYMPDEAPKKDFKVIRSTVLPPGDGTEREVSLVWNGEGYVLAQSVDGEKFEPLER